ncbi:MAG: hypothetical protein OTI36_14640, partial [Beijerinckiaceae bacterium]|nr:hypothetical protein [Beijerinckiaceae bacterium]
LKVTDVQRVLAALQTIAYAEVKKTEKFVIPQLAMLKVKHKPAHKARRKHVAKAAAAAESAAAPAADAAAK